MSALLKKYPGKADDRTYDWGDDRMLIQCGKCGKMYDYDKYSGICPKCARYNRLDSREDMEQNMHDRYDTGSHPHQHDWYQEPKNTYKHSPKILCT